MFKTLLAFMCVVTLSSALAVEVASEIDMSHRVESETPGVLLYNIFSKTVQPKLIPKATRLLVITELSCKPCRLLKPKLDRLKKSGSDIHTYTSTEWNQASPKPKGLPLAWRDKKDIPPNTSPKQLERSVPFLIFVDVGKDNKMVSWAKGNVSESFIKGRME